MKPTVSPRGVAMGACSIAGGDLQVVQTDDRTDDQANKVLDASAPRPPSNASRFRCAGRSHTVPAETRLGIVLEMRTQLCNRPEAHGPVWKLRFDGAVGIERVGHAVDHAGLEDCDRARLPLGTRRLAAQGWLPRDLVRLRLVTRSPLRPHGVELFSLLRRTRWRLRPKQEIKPGLSAGLRSAGANLRLGSWL